MWKIHRGRSWELRKRELLVKEYAQLILIIPSISFSPIQFPTHFSPSSPCTPPPATQLNKKCPAEFATRIWVAANRLGQFTRNEPSAMDSSHSYQDSTEDSLPLLHDALHTVRSKELWIKGKFCLYGRPAGCSRKGPSEIWKYTCSIMVVQVSH